MDDSPPDLNDTFRRALEHVDRTRCERLVKPGRCFDSYPRDEWCDACVASEALAAVDPTRGLRHLAEWIREQYPMPEPWTPDHPSQPFKNIAFYIDREARIMAEQQGWSA